MGNLSHLNLANVSPWKPGYLGDDMHDSANNDPGRYSDRVVAAGGSINYGALAADLLARAHTLLPEWFPAGKRAGHEFKVGNLSGEAGRSLSINMNTGVWTDFGSSEKGGADLTSLYAAQHGMSQHDAAMELSNGNPPSSPRNVVAQRPAPVKENTAVSKASPRANMAANEAWNRFVPASYAHPYIVTKGAAGVPLETLRVVPVGDPLTIQGESMVGALVVPMQQADGTLSSLQFVTVGDVAARLKANDKSTKLNFPGCPVQGCFIVGELVPGGIAYIVEGIGQAWACWQANGQAAVVCFGAGNMRKVAIELRQQDPSARLVLVPDVGKAVDAQKIAAEVGAAVAAMPEGEANNFDANDLAQRDGSDVLAALLAAATEPSKPAPHPLARFVDYDLTPKIPRWLIPDFIAHGVVTIAGARGVGKTTAILPLSMVVAGLCAPDDPLAVKHWRHVIYITEDIEQAVRILAGIVKYGNMGVDEAKVLERFHLVEAARLNPVVVIGASETYRQQFTRQVGEVEVLPLVVFDTVASILALENENDNSEVGRAIAMLKQQFSGLPVWLVFHLAKASTGSTDVPSLSARGGGAFEGDANQNLYLVDDQGMRRLIRGKTRFEGDLTDLQIESFTAKTTAQDEYGDWHDLTLRWGVAAPPEKTRQEAKEDREKAEKKLKEQEAKLAASALRDEVREVVEAAWQTGNPLNREGVKARVEHKRQDVSDTIVNLLSERWLYEVHVPSAERTNPKRSSFLVNITTEEHEAFVGRGELPSAKLEIPASWRKKKPDPSVPAPEMENPAPDEKNDDLRVANDGE